MQIQYKDSNNKVVLVHVPDKRKVEGLVRLIKHFKGGHDIKVSNRIVTYNDKRRRLRQERLLNFMIRGAWYAQYETFKNMGFIDYISYKTFQRDIDGLIEQKIVRRKMAGNHHTIMMMKV